MIFGSARDTHHLLGFFLEAAAAPIAAPCSAMSPLREVLREIEALAPAKLLGRSQRFLASRVGCKISHPDALGEHAVTLSFEYDS